MRTYLYLWKQFHLVVYQLDILTKEPQQNCLTSDFQLIYAISHQHC